MGRQRPLRALSKAPPEERQPVPMAKQQPRGGECCRGDEHAFHCATRCVGGRVFSQPTRRVKTLKDVLRYNTQPQPMTDKRSTHKLQDPVSTWGPKWAGWELSESAHAEAGQHNALTSRLHQCMLWGSMHSLKSTVWSYAIA